MMQLRESSPYLIFIEMGKTRHGAPLVVIPDAYMNLQDSTQRDKGVAEI